MCRPYMSSPQGNEDRSSPPSSNPPPPHPHPSSSHSDSNHAPSTASATTRGASTTTVSTVTINNRLIRHSYEEVDVDWPALVTASTGSGEREGVRGVANDDGEDTVSRHSYEKVDFENGFAEGGGGGGLGDEVANGRVEFEANLHSNGSSSHARGQVPARINLSHTIRRLRMCGWYWGDISSEQAKEILRRAPNGSFILRDSSDACHLFTLSLKSNNLIVSVRVAFSRGLFKLDSWNQEDSPSFQSVVDMIEYYLEDESHEFYVELPHIGEFPVCLKHPIWKEVPGLQHLCRTTIVKYTRTSEKLRLLPLPPHLIRYVLEFSPEDNVNSEEEGAADSIASDNDESSDSPTLFRNVYPPIEPTA